MSKYIGVAGMLAALIGFVVGLSLHQFIWPLATFLWALSYTVRVWND